MANNLLDVWGTVGSVLLAVFMLLIMVTIHEFGHYIAGKILHFKINEFSVGFGPALLKHRNKKTGELFALRLIPLGGYCAFAGEDGLEEEEQKKEEQPKTEPFTEFGDKEEPAEPSAVEEPKKEQAESKPAEVDKSGYFTNKKPWQRIIVLLAGAFMNYVLAVLLIMICFFAYGQTMIAVYEMAPREELSSEIPAEYCLQDLDVLLQVDGRNIYMQTDIAQALNGKKANEKVSFRVRRAVNVVKEVDPETGVTKYVSYDREPEPRTVEIMLQSDVTVRNSSDINSVWAALGVKCNTGEGGVKTYDLANALSKFGFFETLGRSFVYSFKIAGSIFKVLGELLTGRIGISSLGGPVTTITTTAQVVSRGFRYFLEIAGFIGVNLAVFNLLPIPALDGSKVVFTVIEWIRGKPISRKVEAIIHAVGFILLLGFAVLVDILQFVL